MLVMLRDGPQLKEQRRLCAQVMGSKVTLNAFTPVVERETRTFVRRLLDEPNDTQLRGHVRR
jgi:cytochrome P450